MDNDPQTNQESDFHQARAEEEEEKEDFCYHDCTSNCRREGCNCECGEFHKLSDE